MFGGLQALTLIVTILLPNHHTHRWTYREHGIVVTDGKCHERAEELVATIKRRLPTAKVTADATCSDDPTLHI
jgi:hypothetical protein